MTANLPPRSHTHDPPSSKAAEARTIGTRARHMAATLELVKRYPRRTGTELATLAVGNSVFSAEPYRRLCQIRKRLSDLLLLEKVVQIRLKGQCAWEAVTNDEQRALPLREE